jgi:N-dimethylarginine dimethylaminohydrolase
MPQPSFFMCRPTYYGINYKINAWMDLRRQADRSLALKQWFALRTTLKKYLGAIVHCCAAQPGLPDMTFTANAGLVYENIFVPSRFRYKERTNEEPYFTRWFQRHGYKIIHLPREYRFEGAGDALFVGKTLFAGFYYRTDIQTHAFLGEVIGVRVFSLELINRYFYHIDTCFLPISTSAAIYYPDAFDDYGRKVLRENIDVLIAVDHDEAYHFACNAVVAGKKAIIHKPCLKLESELRRHGYTVYSLGFSEFIKAGGAAKCLTLRLT